MSLVKENKLMLAALALIAYSVIVSMGFVLAQNESDTDTDTDTEILLTGDESIPVESQTGQVEEAAPAESINTLLTTIFTVAIPAVTGLIIAIATLVKNRSTNKKVDENSQKVIDAAKYIDTIAPKIQEQYVASGATKAAIELVTSKLSPQDQEAVRRLIATKVPEANAAIRETAEQINYFREKLPATAVADKDPAIPRPVTRPEHATGT